MASKIVVNLDTSKENYIVAKCKQNDDLLLIANIYENGASKDLTNCSIVVQAKKADNTYIIQNTDISKDKNKFIADLVRDFTRVPGETKIEVVLTESSKQNTTFSFCLEVVGSVIRGAEESKDLITSLEVMQDAVVEMGKISEETKELIKNSGAASKEEINKVNASLAEKQNKTDNSLLTTVKNIVGAINEIYNGIKTEVVSRRVRGQNSVDSPAGTFDFANFAGQGKTSNIPIGGAIHHYTDGKTIQIDNVGEGNVIVTMVNAHNAERRPDKDENFFGTGYYLQLMTNNPNTNEVYSHFVIDNNGNPFWNGVLPSGVKGNVTTFKNGKDDMGLPCFEFTAINKHQRPYALKNADVLLFYIEENGEVCSLNTTKGYIELKASNGGVRLVSKDESFIDLVGSTRIKGLNGDMREVQLREVGARSGYSSERLKAGVMIFDNTLNKPVWRNKDNNGWIDLARFVDPPIKKTSVGIKGDFSADTNYFYVCYDANSWLRIAKDSTW